MCLNVTAVTENFMFKKINGLSIQYRISRNFKNKFDNRSYSSKMYIKSLKIGSKLKKELLLDNWFYKKRSKMIQSKKIPILKAGNMSLGINLLM